VEEDNDVKIVLLAFIASFGHSTEERKSTATAIQ